MTIAISPFAQQIRIRLARFGEKYDMEICISADLLVQEAPRPIHHYSATHVAWCGCFKSDLKATAAAHAAEVRRQLRSSGSNFIGFTFSQFVCCPTHHTKIVHSDAGHEASTVVVHTDLYG